ncbi:caldesmon-like [Strongylocentrotus purpuratus]|uniref:Uncharacterized protein n=1 Tax=Strongylocentrotus purpuratus TaxID=7668 RepID=A0A7M7NF28_STRPU|nr:caldesmon-like [Strongylocentrotus purpuratus]
MATSSSVIRKGKLEELRREILSYKPGKAVPCDDDRVVFPDKLVIGMIDLFMYAGGIVPALRSALYGDVEQRKLADKRQTSIKDLEEYFTDSISVITTNFIGVDEEDVRDLAGKVGCMVLLLEPSTFDFYQQWIKTIKSVIGLVPICAMDTTWQSEDTEKAKKRLKKLGVTDIYDVSGGNRSDEKRLQWLHLLHGCMKKGDEVISADLIQLYSCPSFERLWKQGRKDVTEAQKRHGEEIKEGEEAKKLLRSRITDLEQELNESRANRASIVSKNGRLQDTMKVEQERREHSERAMMENEKRAKQIMETYKQREMEFEKKLKSKDLHIKTMAENVQGTEEKARRQVERLETDNEEMMTKLVSKLQREDTLTKMLEEKERNETTLKQQVKELKKGREGDRAGAEKEKRSLAAEMTNIVQGKERNETTLRQQVKELKKGREGDRAGAEKEKRSLAAEMTNIVQEKERNETTLRQQVEELKKGREEDRKEKRSIELSWKKKHDYTEGLLEQLKRETWKLRTKIQLESEIRSAEQKKKAETHQWSLIPWVTSGKQAQSGTSSFEDNSTGGLGSDTVQAG